LVWCCEIGADSVGSAVGNPMRPILVSLLLRRSHESILDGRVCISDIILDTSFGGRPLPWYACVQLKCLLKIVTKVSKPEAEAVDLKNFLEA